MEQYAGTLESTSDLQRFSDEKPPIIYSDFPLDREGIDEVQRIKLEGKVLEIAQIHLYRPRTELLAALHKRQFEARRLLDSDGLQQTYSEWLQKNDKAEDEVLILQFTGRYDIAWLIFDLEGRLIGHF